MLGTRDTPQPLGMGSLELSTPAALGLQVRTGAVTPLERSTSVQVRVLITKAPVVEKTPRYYPWYPRYYP